MTVDTLSAPYDDDEDGSSIGSGKASEAAQEVTMGHRSIERIAQVSTIPNIAPEQESTGAGIGHHTNDTSTETGQITASAPLLAIVAVIAFLTILLLFIGMIRYRFCKRASYHVNEVLELETLTKKQHDEQDTNVVIAADNTKVQKEWLV